MEFHSVGWIYPTLGGIESRSQTLRMLRAEKCYKVSPETRDCDQSPIKCYSWSYITAQYPDPSQDPPAQPTFQRISHQSVECLIPSAILVFMKETMHTPWLHDSIPGLDVPRVHL